jgi:hypothetical protein
MLAANRKNKKGRAKPAQPVLVEDIEMIILL